MKKRINVEDNIFSLNTRLRMIRDTLLLDTDPDLFLGKILDDIEFIDRALGILLNNLRENQHLIDREEQFQNLTETERQFLAALDFLCRGDGNISAKEFPILGEKADIIRRHIQERLKIIDEAAASSAPASTEPVVSTDELSELLRDLR